MILQKLRETEKEIQVKRFVDHIGEIETGIVQRVEGNTVLWEIGRAIALMPEEERIMSEFYRTGSRHKVLLKEISQTPKGKTIIVSRASSEFLKALFELEIPELQSGTVEIKGVAREAGMRSKVAVVSNVDGIDPIGSCVGQRGMRIMAIMGELKVGSSEEKVDIILWDDDPEQFVVNALSPAQVVSTKITDKERKIIEVIVPDEQLSLAIGRDGQNVRLAAKLTGWNIDIQGETIKVGTDQRKENEEKADKNKKKENKKETIDWISELKLNSRLAGIIEKSGINSLDDLKEKIENGEKIAGVGPKSVEEIQKALK